MYKCVIDITLYHKWEKLPKLDSETAYLPHLRASHLLPQRFPSTMRIVLFSATYPHNYICVHLVFACRGPSTVDSTTEHICKDALASSLMSITHDPDHSSTREHANLHGMTIQLDFNFTAILDSTYGYWNLP